MYEDDFIEEFNSIMAWFGYEDLFSEEFDELWRISNSIAALVERYEHEQVEV